MGKNGVIAGKAAGWRSDPFLLRLGKVLAFFNYLHPPATLLGIFAFLRA